MTFFQGGVQLAAGTLCSFGITCAANSRMDSYADAYLRHCHGVRPAAPGWVPSQWVDKGVSDGNKFLNQSHVA